MNRSTVKKMGLVLALLCVTPTAKPTIGTEMLGVIACGYGIHVFAQENRSWFGSIASMAKSGLLLYSGWMLLGDANGLQALGTQMAGMVALAATLGRATEQTAKEQEQQTRHEQHEACLATVVPT
ncbi:MAG TPA: hypothetical protein VLG71_00105 [Candidatus Limnocylindria bacterium]|nr:hypothetical protein [Candidatus Limnocylindria bacterium]